MINKVRSLQEHGLKEDIQDLSQSLIGIKEAIKKCKDDLENSVQINPSLLHTMKNSMKEVERAKEAIHGMSSILKNMSTNFL